MQEEEEKTFAGRFGKYCGSCCAAIIFAVLGVFVFFDLLVPPITFPPTLEEVIFLRLIPFGLATIIVGIPLWLILQFIVWPRLQSDNQSSKPEETT